MTLRLLLLLWFALVSWSQALSSSSAAESLDALDGVIVHSTQQERRVTRELDKPPSPRASFKAVVTVVGKEHSLSPAPLAERTLAWWGKRQLDGD